MSRSTAQLIFATFVYFKIGSCWETFFSIEDRKLEDTIPGLKLLELLSYAVSKGFCETNRVKNTSHSELQGLGNFLASRCNL